MKAQSKFKVFAILVIFALLLAIIPKSVVYSQTEDGYICGQWEFNNSPGRMGGWWFFPWPNDVRKEGWAAKMLLPSGWGAEMNGAYTRIWHPTIDLHWDIAPIFLDIGEYKVVPSCDPIIDFRADNETVIAGQCTQLHWNVDVAELNMVYLDNQKISPVGQIAVCPNSSETFTLQASITYDKYIPNPNPNYQKPDELFWLSSTLHNQYSSTVTVNVSSPTNTPLPTDTPLPSPTNTSIPLPTNTFIPPTKTSIPVVINNPTTSVNSPKLLITDIQIDPSSINQYERTFMRIGINTAGASLPYDYWSNFSFTGEVVVKDSKGKQLNIYQFANHDNAYLLPAARSNEVLITAKLSFNDAVENGSMEVFVYTNDQPQQVLEITLPITVVPQNLQLLECGSVVADKMCSALGISSGICKAVAANKLSAELNSCKDVSCAAKSIVQYVQDVAIDFVFKEPGSLITATRDAVEGQDGLNVCKNPALWIYSILDESSRSGIPINMRAVHSPALLMVTNQSGKRVGFLDMNNPLADINGSVAFTYGDSQYVYFPAQDTTTQLTGTGNGMMTIDTLNVQQGQVVDATFINIPVSSQTVAKLDSSNSTTKLAVTNGNDTQTIQPDYETTHQVEAKQEQSKVLLFIQNNIFIIGAGVLTVILLTVMFWPQNRHSKRGN